jgi:transglutaminase/protease-like cytokinesis protein 3
VVSGYALGVGEDTEWTEKSIITDYQNHAWNEVYVGGRWVIVDTTWDTANKIENGVMSKGEEVSHLYFDSNLQFFSQTHKILEYSRRR